MFTIESDAVRVVFNPEGGHLEEVVFRAGGREIRPMNRPPWRTSGETLPAGTPVIERSLAGDFFCAPFGPNDLDGGPAHGLSANAEWKQAGEETLADGGKRVAFVLAVPVMGAELRKEITLRPGQPVVYERHVFRGGEGRLPAGHHPMVRAPGGLALSFSPKAFGLTAATRTEADPSVGRSVLAYPQRFASLEAVRLADGRTVDASAYPFAERHEDIALLAEAPGARYGWSTGLAAADGFLFFAVKDAAKLPFTLLWMSNGGRDYSPWNGRHDHVIGIEEIRSYFHLGHRAALADNDLTAAGYPTSFTLAPQGSLVITYAFGAIPAPAGWQRVRNLELEPDRVRLHGEGAPVDVPFDAAALDLPAS